MIRIPANPSLRYAARRDETTAVTTTINDDTLTVFTFLARIHQLIRRAERSRGYTFIHAGALREYKNLPPRQHDKKPLYPFGKSIKNY